jgi:methionine aminopeptidase
VICHGIPDCRPIVDGDIINLDVTVYVEYKGKCYHGDLNEVRIPRSVTARATGGRVPISLSIYPSIF